MARPLLPIRPDQVLFLARRGMSVVEIAAFFHCDRGTLFKRFAAEVLRVRGEGPAAVAAAWGPGVGGRAASLPPCMGPTCFLHG